MDYIMRMIEQFMQALASIITLRKAGRHDDALEAIYRNSEKYLGEDISALITKSPSELLNHYRKGGKLDTDRCLIAADLLNEIALISDAAQPKNASRRLKVSCLHLYCQALLAEPALRKPVYEEKIGALRAELKDLPPEVEQAFAAWSKAH